MKRLARCVVSLAVAGLFWTGAAASQVTKPSIKQPVAPTKPQAPPVALVRPAAGLEPGDKGKPGSHTSLSLAEAQAELASVRQQIRATTGVAGADILTMQRLMTRRGELEGQIANLSAVESKPSADPLPSLRKP
jgi:hypothetical protein